MTVGFTYSQTGEYDPENVGIVLLREKELARGDLIYVRHPKNNLPVVYQVIRIYPYKKVRGYEAAFLKEGRVINDDDNVTIHAEAHQWGWIDEGDNLRLLRYSLLPNTPVYKADKFLISKFTKPSSEWKLFLGMEPNSEIEVELGVFQLIRQSCLICGAVGTGKTTTAVSMVARAASLNPPVRFFILDKDGEYASLINRLGKDKVINVPWIRFFRPSDIPWENYISEFGWLKTWWNAKILIKSLKDLYARRVTVTKQNLVRAINYVNSESLGYIKKEDEFEKYRQQVLNAVNSSKLIPDGELKPLDPVDVLSVYRVVIMDLSQSRDSWTQKHLVVSQVLKRIFNEALENRKFGCAILLEEAMYYAPQRGAFEVGEKESRRKLLNVIKEIATNGGRNGVGLWLVTQRLATVEKTVVTQCANNIICHSLEDIDKQRLCEIVGAELGPLIGSLTQGEAIVKGTALKCRFPIYVKVLPEVYPASAITSPMSRFIYMEHSSIGESFEIQTIDADN